MHMAWEASLMSSFCLGYERPSNKKVNDQITVEHRVHRTYVHAQKREENR